MLNADDIKFVELFVDFRKDGVSVQPDLNEVDWITKKKIVPAKIDSWKIWLRRQCERPDLEDEDAWDEWYRNLTVEDIPEAEIARFDLPTEKIVIDLDWAQQLTLGLYGCVKSFVEEAQSLPLYESNVVVGYKVGKMGVHAFFYVPNHVQLPESYKKKTYLPGTYTEVYNLYKKWICGDGEGQGKAEAVLAQFKPIAEQYGVIITDKKTAKRSSGVGKGNDDSYITGKWWTFDSYDLNEGGNKVFIDKLFSLTDDRFESRRRPSV